MSPAPQMHTFTTSPRRQFNIIHGLDVTHACVKQPPYVCEDCEGVQQRVEDEVADGVELVRRLVVGHVDREQNVCVVVRVVRRLHRVHA
jgi:hypothetical protein